MRRSLLRVRHLPVWSAHTDLPTHPIGANPPDPSARKRWLVATGVALVAFGVWAFVSAGAGGGVGKPAPPERPIQDVVEVPPAPETPPEMPITPPEAVPQTVQPQAPSVGLLSSGEAGGSGNGTPGLDLGLEGKGEGMLVAAGGGGSGNGAGTGVGNGIGTSRMVYETGQVDEDVRPVGTLARPDYPRRAREDGIEAVVEVRVLVDERGRVEKLEILGAPPGYGFETSIRNASSRWRFQPAQLGGVAVPQWARISFPFRLGE